MREIVPFVPERPNPSAWVEVPKLAIGEGFLVPWTELSERAIDPMGLVRSIASIYSKQLGRRFRTRKEPRGIWLYRIE
jgi:hypothetical protein